MQTVSPFVRVNGLRLANPWRYLDEALRFWVGLADSVSTNLIQELKRRMSIDALSPKDQALEQYKKVQWLLYKRHTQRSGWKPHVPPGRECWRFIQWSERHSKNFRHLLALYQIDWFKRYADLTDGGLNRSSQRRNRHQLEKLLKEIELHLYQ